MARPRPGPRPPQPSRTPREHGEKAFCNVSPFQVVGKETSHCLLRLLLCAVTLKYLNDLQNGSRPAHGLASKPDGQLHPEISRTDRKRRAGRPEVLGRLPLAPPFSGPRLPATCTRKRSLEAPVPPTGVTFHFVGSRAAWPG